MLTVAALFAMAARSDLSRAERTAAIIGWLRGPDLQCRLDRGRLTVSFIRQAADGLSYGSSLVRVSGRRGYRSSPTERAVLAHVEYQMAVGRIVGAVNAVVRPEDRFVLVERFLYRRPVSAVMDDGLLSSRAYYQSLDRAVAQFAAALAMR